MKFQLDRTDRQILNILQRNNRISNLQLAEEVSLSPPACLKRVKRLRESGVIEADVAILDSRILGKMLNIIVEVEMIRDQADLADAFMRKMQLANEVTQCYQVTGEVDFLLVVMVPDMEAYEVFVRRDLSNDPYLRKFRTLISMRRDKFTTRVDV